MMLGGPFGDGFDLMFTVVPILFFAVFLLILGIILYRLARGAMKNARDNAAPVLTVAASVVTKRTETRRYRRMDAGSDGYSTEYYATFEVESGDRIELAVRGPEYGMIAEGDRGRLTFQGGRYLGFERGDGK